MNILIIGLGSIGQRHLRNLKKIEPKSKFYAIRSQRNEATPLLNNFNKVIKGNIKKKYSLCYFNSLFEIYKKKIKIDCAFVCTPSSLHVAQAIDLLKYNIPFFIEKPLGSSTRRLKELERLFKKKNIITMVGFQLRFNPLIKYLEKIGYVAYAPNEEKISETSPCPFWYIFLIPLHRQNEVIQEIRKAMKPYL